MDWDAIGAIGNLLGAVGVTATLGYLVVQLRQNNRQLRLNTANVVTEELQTLFSLLCADSELSAVFVEAAQTRELEGTDRVRYFAFTNNLVRVHENGYLQMREGAISAAHWEGITRMMIDYTKMPAFGAYWSHRKHWSSDEFVEHVEHVESEVLSQPARANIGPAAAR